jgi:hypothetical protein
LKKEPRRDVDETRTDEEVKGRESISHLSGSFRFDVEGETDKFGLKHGRRRNEIIF